jgi:hypothetical protein
MLDQFKTKQPTCYPTRLFMKYILILSAILVGIYLHRYTPHLYVYQPVEVTTVSPTPTPRVDDLVDTYSKKYGKTRYQQNRIKAMLHFLLLREQNYGGSNNCGDSGKACGPLQFHAGTYKGYRNIMIKRGLITDMGSRLSMNDAVETAAWAISDGRERAWGPVARNEIIL